MILDLTFPAQSPTMTEGTLVAWKIKKGDQVKKGQVIAEVQTDKSVADWESPESGTIAAVVIEAGTLAQVNQVAAILTTKGEDPAAAVAKAVEKNRSLAHAASSAISKEGGSDIAAKSGSGAMEAPLTIASLPAKTGVPIKGLRASPVASRIAVANRLDLSAIRGSGPDGRIIKRDVEAAIANGSARIRAVTPERTEVPKLKPFRADGPSTTQVPLSPMRKVIGQRLLQAKQQIPHFYVTDRIDASALVELREQLNRVEGVRVSVNDLIVRACALALRMHPKVNATFDGNAITYHDSTDISVAVAIPDGLITPIVFGAHRMSLRQIGDKVRELAKKAMDGKLQPQEFQGGTFTVSNLGMYGIESFAAIINPPQAAILAIAGISDEPVICGGAVVPGKVLRVTLSADHRVVDGAVGAEFVRTVKQLLEAPASLLL